MSGDRLIARAEAAMRESQRLRREVQARLEAARNAAQRLGLTRQRTAEILQEVRARSEQPDGRRERL